MKVRLYLDEDSMDRALIRALHARGVDVTAALERGMIERDDETHLAFATKRGRVLHSFNVGDFHRIHSAWLRQGQAHAGIVVSLQQRYSIGEQMRRLLRLINKVNADDMRNRPEFLSNWA